MCVFLLCLITQLLNKGLTVESDQLGLYTQNPTVWALIVDVLGTRLKGSMMGLESIGGGGVEINRHDTRVGGKEKPSGTVCNRCGPVLLD